MKQTSNQDIALAIAMIALAIGVIGWGLPTPVPQNFGCIFDTVSKTGCQTGNCQTIQDSMRGPITGPDINCTVVFPNAFATAPKSILVTFDNQTEILCQENCTTPFGYSGYGFTTTTSVPFFAGSSFTITAMPLAITPFPNNNAIAYFAITSCLYIVLEVNVITAGTATSLMRIQYSPPGYGGDATGPWANLMPGNDISLATAGFQVASPANNIGVPFNASIGNYGGIYLRMVTLGGNGVVSPQIGLTQLACGTQSPAMGPVGYDKASVTTTGFNVMAYSNGPFIYSYFVPPTAQPVKWSWTWTAMS